METKNFKIAVAKAVLGVGLMLQTSGAFASWDYFEQWRCTQQDPEPRKAVAIIAGRLQWANKCYPDLMEFFRFDVNPAGNMHNFPQGRAIVYPVFGYYASQTSPPTILQAPTDPNVGCDTLTKQAPKQRIMIVGFCGLGCLTGNQIVEFGQEPLEIGSKEAAAQKVIMTLKEGSNAQSMRYQSTPLRQIVTDLEPTHQKILKITTMTGNSIQVTPNHPLIDGEGLVRRADQLTIGDELTRADGEIDLISSIEKSEFFGRVYNIRVDSPKLEDNIYISQGFLSGSVEIQNDEVHYLNRKLLRKADFFSVN